MQNAYILSIDQSTQGTKAMLFDEHGHLLARADKDHRQIVNDKGWVEHDLTEIADNMLQVVRQVITESGIDKENIKAVGVTNQRESVGIWDRKTGEPVCHSIVWQCNRASDLCSRLSEKNATYLFETTGLRLSPFFSGPKIAWILENVPGVRKRAEHGELCCGTMNSWVIFTLTGGKVHKTDISNAARMLLVNLKTLNWDAGALEIFNIPETMLPVICDSDSIFGETDFDGFLDHPIPIHANIGDSNAALYAQGCHSRGDCMTGYGTGSSVMMNIGDKPIFSDLGILTAVAWRSAGQTHYMFDGVVNYSGAVVKWLVNDLCLVRSPIETDAVAASANPADKTYLVPAFTGIGAPHWSNRSNAVFSGMTRLTGRAELVRAALESVAYQISDLVFAMSEAANVSVSRMRVSGGPTKNQYLMQFQSDILNCKILVPQNTEMSSQGIAYMAGIAANLYDPSIILGDANAKVFLPSMDPIRRQTLIEGWKAALHAAISM